MDRAQPNQGADMSTGMIISIAFFAVAIISHSRRPPVGGGQQAPTPPSGRSREDPRPGQRGNTSNQPAGGTGRGDRRQGARRPGRSSRTAACPSRSRFPRSGGRPHAIGSTSSGTAQTLWTRPRRHPKRRSRPSRPQVTETGCIPVSTSDRNRVHLVSTPRPVASASALPADVVDLAPLPDRRLSGACVVRLAIRRCRPPSVRSVRPWRRR